MTIEPWLVGLIIVLLLLAFSGQIIYLYQSAKRAVISVLEGESTVESEHGDCGCTENFSSDPKLGSGEDYQPETVDTLTALGYEAGPWDEVMKASELDPSVFINHQNFVKDVRRFSSGANFTSVTDDNTNSAFVNFQGLRRPEAYIGMIGDTARQIPDIDETVLARNLPFRFNSTS